MRYVYGCDEHTEIREEVTHGMLENPVIPCPECGKAMHRIPQVPKWYNNPQNILFETLEKEQKAKRRARDGKRS